MTFDISHNGYTTDRNLCCLADTCSKLPLLISLKMRISPEGTLITILNNTLHCNSSISELTLLSYTPACHFFDLFGPMYPYCVPFLSRALRKDPEILINNNLHRSNSLHSQQSLHCPSSVMRSHSSPDDPSGLQNMHPLLYKALGVGNSLHSTE